MFHPLCSWVLAGYENWYPFDMSCSVVMYINSGGFGLNGEPIRPEPIRAARSATAFELWGNIANDSTQALLVASGTGTVYNVTTAPADTHCFFWVKAVNSLADLLHFQKTVC